MQFELFYSKADTADRTPISLRHLNIRPRNNLVQGGFSLGNKDSVYVKKGEIYLNSPNFENDPISKLAVPSFEEMTGND